MEEGDRLLLSVLQLLEDGLEYTFRCLVQRLEGGEKKKASRLLRLQLLRPEERPGGPPLPGPLCLAVQSHQPEGPAALTPEQTERRPSLYLSLSGAERGAAVFYL